MALMSFATVVSDETGIEALPSHAGVHPPESSTNARLNCFSPESLMIEITGVESKIEGLIQVLNETENRVLEVCRSGKMTMRRGHHSSGVLRAMGAGEPDTPKPGNQPLEAADNFADNI